MTALEKKFEEIIEMHERRTVLSNKIITVQNKKIEELKFKLLQLQEEDEYET